MIIKMLPHRLETTKQVEIHDVIETLVATLNVRDKYTFQHSWRVAKLATIIAQNMGLTDNDVELIHQAAHLHDIGKVGVADNVLNKPGRLNDREMKEMQAHPVIGHDILYKVPVFESISDIVLHHHERYDGLGYPSGLQGEDIPLASRIITVADAFDAITSNRAYRRAQDLEYAYHEINDHIGDQFCPLAVKHFNLIFDQLPLFLQEVEREIEHSSINDQIIVEVEHDNLFHSKKL
ncbi:MAG: HD-GYP domain-containing protein [Bacillota bacterium]